LKYNHVFDPNYYGIMNDCWGKNFVNLVLIVEIIFK